MEKLNQKMVMAETTIPLLQTAVYVMCGGGMLGTFAAEQPGNFYIDTRVGRLPYPKKAIYQVVKTLCTHAIKFGLDPKRLSDRPLFPNCGIF